MGPFRGSDAGTELGDAFVEVVGAIDASVGSRLDRFENRVFGAVRGASGFALLLAAVHLSAALAWLGANVGLAMFVLSRHGSGVAVFVVTATNVVVAAAGAAGALRIIRGKSSVMAEPAKISVATLRGAS